MKQEQNIETKAQSLNQQGIDDAVAGFNKTIIRGYPNLIKFQSTSILDSQGLGRDGPPGRARSPGTLQTQFPDYPPDDGKKVQLLIYNNGKSKTKPYSLQSPPVGGLFPLSFQREGSPELVEGEGEFGNINTMNINTLLINKKQIFLTNIFLTF